LAEPELYSMERKLTDDDAGSDGWFSRGRLSVIVLLVATAIAIYLCYLLMVPFLPALAWAVALVVIALPVHCRIEARIKRPSIAAGVSVTLVALFVVVPAMLIGLKLTHEATAGIESIRQRAEDGRWREVLEQNPRLAQAITWVEERTDIEQEASKAVSSTFAGASSLLQSSLWVGTALLITLFVLFFLLRDRRAALKSLRELLPLTDREADTLLGRIRDTIQATVFGTVVVAIVQGTLGGLMFWLLGLPGALLWGVVMAVLAIVPVLGAFVVWVPAAIFLAISGSWGKALLLTGWGTIVVGTIDNLLYPFLVGNKLRLHTVPVFFAIVGGLAVFGAAGVILGPVVLAVTLGLIDIWKSRTRAGNVAEAVVANA
jgi:predicted PurR-regulated permease PerM